MGRSTAEALGTSYRNSHKAAKPGDRSAINERVCRELEELKSQLASDLASHQRNLVDVADDVPAKRGIQQRIEALQLEINDVADLQSLIEKRRPEDDRHRVQAEANRLVAER